MAGRGIVIQIQGDGESARQALEMVREQLKETAESSKETGGAMEEAFERAKSALETVGLYMGIREIVDGLKELAKASFEFGESMLQASQKTGVSVESLSVLKYAAGELGTSFDGLVTGIGRMQKNIQDAATGNSKLAADFAGMGLNAKTLASDVHGSEEAFHRFVETVAATTDVGARNKLVMDLMGRAGLEQVPVLIELAEHWDEYKERAEAAGVVLNGETAKALEETQQKMNDLKARVEGAGLSFTEGLIPGLDQMMDTLREGKSDRDVFMEWGKDLGRVLAFAASSFYAVASGAETVFAVIDALGHDDAGFYRQMEAAKELNKQAIEFREIMEGTPTSASLAKYTGGDIHPADLDQWAQQGSGGAKPFKPTTPEGKHKAAKVTSDSPILEAAAALAAEQAKAAAEAQKNADTVALANLEALHREQLISEQDYLAQKLKLQTDEIDAEMQALQSRANTLSDLYQKQHGDTTLKNRDQNGNSAEELKTMRELEQTWAQMDALATKYQTTRVASSAATAGANLNAELAGLRAAAELEKQRNDGIAAQIALLERETQLNVQKAAAEGASGNAQAQIQANGQLLEQKLRIAEVDRQIQQTEATYNTAAKEIEDRQSKGQITKLQAEKQLNALHQQEVAVLQSLVEQYDALAATLGGPFVQKAQELHAALSELSTPDRKQDQVFGKTLADGVTKMADSIVAQSIRGKTSFKEMAKEMEADAAQLALKLMAMKLMGGGSDDSDGGGGGGGGGGGFLGSLGKMISSLPHFAAGGTPDGPSIVGEEGPELWTPPSKGGTITPNGMLSKLAETGGGGRAPNVTTNIVNQSSHPVQAQPTQVSYDSQAKEFVLHTILEDMASGGHVSQAMQGFARG